MFSQIFLVAVAACVFQASAAEFKDVYGVPVTPKEVGFNQYTCRILEGATRGAKMVREILPPYCGFRTKGDLRVGANYRHLPTFIEGSLPISDLDVYELLKPLNAAGAVCCASVCETDGTVPVPLWTEVSYFTAKVECVKDTDNNDVHKSVVKFIGNFYTCECGGNGRKHGQNLHHRDCPVPETAYERYCCEDPDIKAGKCPQPQEWAKYAFKHV